MRERLDDARRRLPRWWRARGLPARVGVLAAAGVSLGLVIGVALLLARPGGEERPAPVLVSTTTPVSTATSAPPPTATSTPTPTATATPTPTPDPTPEGPPTVQTIQELARQYGEPPDSALGRLRIPSLGVDAPLGTRFVGAGDDIMPNPTGPGDVVWYDLSEWNALGGAPGAGGNAIFSGHVDYAAYVAYADVQFRGRGVFYHLDLLSPGDIIEVDVNGETLRYAVEWRRQVPAGDADWAEIFSGDVGQDRITLYTCGGTFDFSTRSYADRTVVRATRI